MPFAVKKVPPDKEGREFAIYNKDTGRIKGRSHTREAAQRSANAANAGSHGWHGTKKG